MVVMRVPSPVLASLKLDTGQVIERGESGRRVMEDQERPWVAVGNRGRRRPVEEGHSLKKVATHERDVDQKAKALDLVHHCTSDVVAVVQNCQKICYDASSQSKLSALKKPQKLHSTSHVVAVVQNCLKR